MSRGKARIYNIVSLVFVVLTVVAIVLIVARLLTPA